MKSGVAYVGPYEVLSTQYKRSWMKSSSPQASIVSLYIGHLPTLSSLVGLFNSISLSSINRETHALSSFC